MTVCSSAVFYSVFFFWRGHQKKATPRHQKKATLQHPKKATPRHPKKATPRHPKTMASYREDGDGDVGGNNDGVEGDVRGSDHARGGRGQRVRRRLDDSDELEYGPLELRFVGARAAIPKEYTKGDDYEFVQSQFSDGVLIVRYKNKMGTIGGGGVVDGVPLRRLQAILVLG